MIQNEGVEVVEEERVDDSLSYMSACGSANRRAFDQITITRNKEVGL